MPRTISDSSPNPEDARNNTVEAVAAARARLAATGRGGGRALGPYGPRDLAAGEPASEEGVLVTFNELSPALQVLIGGVPAHVPSHGNGGADELDVTGLSGLLADPQTPAAHAPAAHAPAHKNGGADEVATATPAADAIPKALGTGLLAPGWIPPQPTDRIGFSYTAVAMTLTATWARSACFIWKGTTFYGTSPVRIEVAAVRISGSATYDLRVQDITNGLTICSLLLLSNGTLVIHDLGTLSNVPAGQAIFELQAQRATGSANIEVCALEVSF